MCLQASGGNDNYLCIWDAAMSSRTHQPQPTVNTGTHNARMIIREHTAAVKAVSWCPFQSNTLASGGGTADRHIRLWNTASGVCTHAVDTGSQVCAIQWNNWEKELVSSHGFSDNQLILWKYPTMTKVRVCLCEREHVCY
jgi:cell division cycle protein 20 (cofactor of APC complex)